MQSGDTRAIVEDGADRIQRTAMPGQEMSAEGRVARIEEVEEYKKDDR